MNTIESPGRMLETLSWTEAASWLSPERIVVLPLGAQSKEHGPHLPLGTDAHLARWLLRRILFVRPVLATPLIGFHHYPAFVDYPGSISLRAATAAALVTDICVSLARHGPWRFYVINTGISTRRPIERAAENLRARGLVLRYFDLDALDPLVEKIAEQAGGSHADEVETSMMLSIRPDVVRMDKAVEDYHPEGRGPFRREKSGGGIYSPSGVFGNPTMATPAKGVVLMKEWVKLLLRDIDALQALERQSLDQ